MTELKGAPVSEAIKKRVLEELTKLPRMPVLAIVRVGERPDDISYERSAVKKMNQFGLDVRTFCFPDTISGEAFRAEFGKVNRDPQVDGILLLRPLPEQIDEKEITEMMDPRKDLDGISPVNLAKVFAGDPSGFAPCTAEAVVELLRYYQIPLEGSPVTVVGRSMVVGRPLAMLLLQENATVTICHTRTADLKSVCSQAKILVAAAGRARMLDRPFVSKGGVVVDVGINVDADGKLCGDVDFESIRGQADMATPVPGGIGAVTTAVLARHLMRAAGARI